MKKLLFWTFILAHCFGILHAKNWWAVNHTPYQIECIVENVGDSYHSPFREAFAVGPRGSSNGHAIGDQTFSHVHVKFVPSNNDDKALADLTVAQTGYDDNTFLVGLDTDNKFKLTIFPGLSPYQLGLKRRGDVKQEIMPAQVNGTALVVLPSSSNKCFYIGLTPAVFIVGAVLFYMKSHLAQKKMPADGCC